MCTYGIITAFNGENFSGGSKFLVVFAQKNFSPLLKIFSIKIVVTSQYSSCIIFSLPT